MDSVWALNNTTGTMFPDARQPYHPIYSTHPFNSSLCNLISRLPIGFQKLSLQRTLSLDVLEILSRTTQASRLSPQGKARSLGLILLPPRTHRAHNFWEACPSLDAPDDPTTGQPNFEKLLILAVLIYCMHTFSPIRTITALYSGSRMKLTNGFQRRAGGAKLEEQCLFWIGMVRVDAWRAVDEKLLPVGLEFSGELKGSWGQWEEVKGVMGRFHWNSEFEERCRVYWGELN